MEPPARALLYFGLMLLVGLPIGLMGVVMPVFRSAGLAPGALGVLLHARRGLIAAAVAAIGGATAFFVAQVAPLELAFITWAEWSDFIRLSLLGQMLLARLALGAAALAVLIWAKRPMTWSLACVILGVGMQATVARTSHSAAMGEHWLAGMADFAHLFAGAAWGGGLVALGIAVRCVRQPRSDVLDRDENAAAAVTRALIRRFSWLGMSGVALACGTGLALSSLHLPELGALLATSYGGILVAKAALVGLAMILVAMHKFFAQRRMRTRSDVQRFARTLAAETVIVCGVFLAAAGLTSTAPPHSTHTHRMPDGSLHVMTMTDPDFQRALRVAGLATLAAGAVACALEWRAPTQRHS